VCVPLGEVESLCSSRCVSVSGMLVHVSLCHFDVLLKSRRELPEDGADKRRNALQLQVISLSVH